MPRLARSRTFLLPTLLLLIIPAAVRAEDGAVKNHPSGPVPYIVVGFTGGFVRHDNLRHGPVQLAQRIQADVPKGTVVQVFENRHRKTAFRTIWHLLDTDHDGDLSEQEKANARVILFGHSWGASAVVLLARELNHIGVPVLLTVQVDSVAKLWQHDGIIPDNVAQAANFYQPHGLIHGRALIRAADQSKTEILGNYKFDYRLAPVKCAGTSWFERTFTPSHMQSECDPHLWAEVESLVLEHFDLPSGIVASLPK